MIERAWANLFLAGNWLLGLSLGSLVLLALHYVTGARWSSPLRRVLEAMSAALPIAAGTLLAVLVFHPALWPESVSAEETQLHRFWMGRPFFLGRALIYFAVWLGFAMLLVRNSRRQDQAKDATEAFELSEKNRRLSAVFLVVFGVTCWLSSSDWLMALERDWASTIYGVYNFAGMFVSAIAAECLLVVWLRQRGGLSAEVGEDHLHDLGTLLFGFSSFWMYTWFCQYLLIWYVNIPDETTYLRARWQGDWGNWLFLDLALNWAIPFVVLIFRSAKRNSFILASMALLVLIGRWIDLAVMILPTQGDVSSVPGVAEAVWLVGAAGVFGWMALRRMRKLPVTADV